MSKNSGPRNTLNTFQKMAVAGTLSNYIITEQPGHNGAKRCRYLDGYSDERVAYLVEQAHGFSCTNHNVSGVRLQVYGILTVVPGSWVRPTDTPPAAAPEISVPEAADDEIPAGISLLAELEQRFCVLEASVMELKQQNHELIDMLGKAARFVARYSQKAESAS